MAKQKKKGSIFHRKDGRWEGRIVIGYDEKGYPKTKSVTAKSKTACQKKLNELRETMGEIAPEESRGLITFGEWADHWYQNESKPALRPTTRQNYELLLYRHAIPALGHIPLKQLTQADLQRFFVEMKESGRLRNTAQKGKGLSDRTVRSCYSLCRMVLERAVEEKRIPFNPILGCKLPPKDGEEMKTLSQAELQRFLIQAKEDGFFELFLLELTTGMRRGELLALQWDDLDFSTGALQITKQACPVEGKLTVSKPKTKAGSRTILLPPSVVEALREYRKGVFSKWMFPSRLQPEKPLDPTYVRKVLHRILEKADCTSVRFHDLRHTFATMSLEHGMDIKTLSTIIGHASMETTLDTYTHSTDELRRRAALQIDKGIAGVEGEEEQRPAEKEQETPFQAVKPKRRRPGTGCVSQINDHLWEGRYSPKWIDGKKHARNVYAKTEAECEEKLAALILEMKKELSELREKEK